MPEEKESGTEEEEERGRHTGRDLRGGGLTGTFIGEALLLPLLLMLLFWPLDPLVLLLLLLLLL